jgi:flagellar protein FliO/FliZ
MIRFFFTVCLFFSLGIYSQTKEELDSVLQQELGQTTKTQVKESKSKEEVNPVQERYKSNEDSGSLLWTLVKVIFVFGVLTAIMYYVLKYIAQTRNSLYPVKNMMKVISAISIGPNKQLQIVEVSGMLFVLGVSDSSIQLIKEIESSTIKERIFQERDSFEPSKENFFEQFSKNLSSIDLKNTFKQNTTTKQTSEEDVLNEIKQRQLDRLEKLKQERTNLSSKKKDDSSEIFFE